jgi:hypothetical protein
MDETVLADAKLLWNYHRLDQPVGKTDVILGLGSFDGAVAEHAAELFLAGKARWLAFTGGVTRRHDLLRSPWTRAEAEEFAGIARARGVAAERIVVEPRSTNTGENFQYSMARFAELGVACATMTIVTKPYMERRARATAKVHLGPMQFTVTSPPCTFEEYCLRRHDPALIFNLMVGDFQRIAQYPALGFQASEEIPADAEGAYRRMVAAGFDRHLLQAKRA